MQYLLPAVYAIVFLLLIYKLEFFSIPRITRTKLALLFILKLIAGMVVWLVYTQYYSVSDFQAYFSDSKVLIEHLLGNSTNVNMQGWNAAFETTLFNNSRVMIILNVILQLFSFGNFFVHIVFFCFFSFIGLTALYKVFLLHFNEKTNQLMVAIFLIPTILFWSSSALKCSLVIGLAGLVVYLTNFGLRSKYTLLEGISILILLILLFVVKIYVALALIPVLTVNIIVSRTSNKMLWAKYTTVFSFLIMLSFVVKYINPDYNALQLIADKQSKEISEARGGVFMVSAHNFICLDYDLKDSALIKMDNEHYRVKPGSDYMSWKLDNMKDTTFITHSTDTTLYSVFYSISPANTVMDIKRIKPEWADITMYLPEAIVTVLIQPTVFNIKNWLQLGVSIENLWLILLLLLAIFFFDKKTIEKKEVLMFCLVFTIIIFALIGLTTPVTGSMVRYRTIGLLFYASLLFICIDWQKVFNLVIKKKQ